MNTNTTTQAAQERMTAEEFREMLEKEGQTVVYKHCFEELMRGPAQKGEWPELSGICTLYNFVESVLERVEHTFTETELKWLYGFNDTAVTDLITTNSVIQGLAMAVSKPYQANELADESCFPYLFHWISNALSSIEAQLKIASAAQYRLHGV
jgi:hypothetical protein